MKLKKLLTITLLGTLIAMLSMSCTKDRFKLFNDLDCIYESSQLKIEMEQKEIPGEGGFVEVGTNVFIETEYTQFDQPIDTKIERVNDYEVTLISGPDGTTVQRSENGIILNVPENKSFQEVEIVVEISVGEEKKQFTLKQLRLKYNVDVEILA